MGRLKLLGLESTQVSPNTVTYEAVNIQIQLDQTSEQPEVQSLKCTSEAILNVSEGQFITSLNLVTDKKEFLKRKKGVFNE